jgi:acyl dehydratase
MGVGRSPTERTEVALHAKELSVGDRRELVLVDDLTRTQIVQYAGASGDYNPLHTDEVFAREVAGYPSVFAHGMLTMGMTGRVLTDWVGDGRLLRYGVRFVKQVWPGDTLTATAEVTAIGEQPDGTPVADFAVSCTNQNGAEVLAGTATARLDP